MEENEFKVVFSGLKTEDLKEYIRLANEELSTRKANRAKELWGNVVKAINKYQEEVGSYILFIADEEYTAKCDEPSMLHIGEIYLS